MRTTTLVSLIICCLTAFSFAEPYPLATDPTGEKLGDKPIAFQHEGRDLLFASEASLEAFKKDPATMLNKVDEQIVEQQTKIYPLETCVITGEKLGSMGKPVDKVVNNRLERLCCKGCSKKAVTQFDDNVKKLNAAVIEQQLPKYANKTCVVSGDDLGDKPVDHVVAGRLVRLCCDDCIKALDANPAKYLEKIETK